MQVRALIAAKASAGNYARTFETPTERSTEFQSGRKSSNHIDHSDNMRPI